MPSDETDDETRTDAGTDDYPVTGAVLAELAGEGSVEIDPRPGPGPIPSGNATVLGTYDGFNVCVTGPPHSAALDGREVTASWPDGEEPVDAQEFAETWRVTTERGTFDVTRIIDKTTEEWTHLVAVEAVDGTADGADTAGPREGRSGAGHIVPE